MFLFGMYVVNLLHLHVLCEMLLSSFKYSEDFIDRILQV